MRKSLGFRPNGLSQQNQTSSWLSPLSRAESRADLAGLLLVSTVDGSVHALSKETGKPVWSFSSGSPLVSSSMTWAEGPFANECAQLASLLWRHSRFCVRAQSRQDAFTTTSSLSDIPKTIRRYGPSTVVFPHVDGSLYAYQVRSARLPPVSFLRPCLASPMSIASH